MKLEIVKHVTLYKDRRFHAAFPSIIRLDNGEFLLAFRRARDFSWLMQSDKDFDPVSNMDHFDPRSHICLMNFDSELNPLGEPRIYPIDPEAADQDPSLLNLGGGKVLLTSFSWYPVPAYASKKIYDKDVAERVSRTRGCGYYYWGSHAGLSEDNGDSWKFDHQYLNRTDDWHKGARNKTVSGATRGQCLLVGKELLLASYGNDHRAILQVSYDLGATWKEKAVIAEDPNKAILFQEPTLYKAPSGKLIAFMRTQGADFRLATAVSYDNGTSWEPFKLHEIKGQPFHAFPVGDSKMLLSYGYREKPYGVRFCVVNAEFENVNIPEELVICDDIPCADLGYPWSLNLNHNKYFTVYYRTDKTGIRYIEGCIVSLK